MGEPHRNGAYVPKHKPDFKGRTLEGIRTDAAIKAAQLELEGVILGKRPASQFTVKK